MPEPLRKSTSTSTSTREGRSTGGGAAGARTAEAGTQTAISLKLPLLVIGSCVFVGFSSSYWLCAVLLSPLWGRMIPSLGVGGVVAASVLLGAVIFNLSIGLYLAGLRASGVLDHRTARLLAATSIGGNYRTCLHLRRYRVMGEEDAQIYAEDKTASGPPLACCWLAFLALSILIGASFTLLPLPLYDGLLPQWQNGTDV